MLEIACENPPGPNNNEMSRYIPRNVDTRLSNRRDRSSLMTTIGHRIILIKGGRANGAVFFRFGRTSGIGVGQSAFRSRVRQKNRSGMIPARYASHLCLGSAYGPESYWRDIHPPLSPPSVAFFLFLFLSSRIGASLPCLSTVDTPVAVRPLASSRGLREKGGVRRPRGRALPGRPNFNRAYKSFE